MGHMVHCFIGYPVLLETIISPLKPIEVVAVNCHRDCSACFYVIIFAIPSINISIWMILIVLNHLIFYSSNEKLS